MPRWDVSCLVWKLFAMAILPLSIISSSSSSSDNGADSIPSNIAPRMNKQTCIEKAVQLYSWRSDREKIYNKHQIYNRHARLLWFGVGSPGTQCADAALSYTSHAHGVVVVLGSRMNCAKTDEPIEMPCGRQTHVGAKTLTRHGAHWRTSDPRAAVMRPYVQLFWPLV